jgi:hypothetical protein
MTREECIQRVCDDLDPRISTKTRNRDDKQTVVQQLNSDIEDLVDIKRRRMDKVNAYFDALDVVNNPPGDVL